MRDYFSDLVPNILPVVPSVPTCPQQPGTGQKPHEQRAVPGVPTVPSKKHDGRIDPLEAALAEACHRHHLDADAIRAELVEAGDWPDLTAEAVRCYVRCVAQERRNLDALPLADKLRAYSKPYALKVDGRVVCWLVADDNDKRTHRGPEPVYSASEVEALADLPDDEAKALCGWKSHFGGTIREVAE